MDPSVREFVNLAQKISQIMSIEENSDQDIGILESVNQVNVTLREIVQSFGGHAKLSAMDNYDYINDHDFAD